MNHLLTVFQLANLAFFLAVFTGRSLQLWFTQGINPFALVKGKKAQGVCLNCFYYRGWHSGFWQWF